MKKLQDRFETTDQEYIKDRNELFLMLKSFLNEGMNYFIKAAPECIWNEKGYYKLLDGMSRTTFLYTQGFRYVPVKISVTDFHKSIAYTTVSTIEQVFHDRNITELYYDVEHPALMHFPVRHKYVAFTALSCVQEYLGNRSFANNIVLDATIYNGRIGRYFARMMANVYVASPDEIDYNLNALFPELDSHMHLMHSTEEECIKHLKPEFALFSALENKLKTDIFDCDSILFFEDCTKDFIAHTCEKISRKLIKAVSRKVGNKQLEIMFFCEGDQNV